MAKIKVAALGFFWLGALALAPVAHAINLGFEPILGYEVDQKSVPTPHTHGHFMYGARVIVGPRLLAFEAEYTRGSDSESFTNPSLQTNDTVQRGKLGVRSTLYLTNKIAFIARGGLSGEQDHHTEASGGQTTVDSNDSVVYDPYLGAGLRLWMTQRVALTGEVTAIIPQFSNSTQNQYEYSAGFIVRFP